MEPLATFLEMGGYAAYVWPSFLITAALLVGLAGASRKAWRDSVTVLEALQADRRRGRRDGGAGGDA